MGITIGPWKGAHEFTVDSRDDMNEWLHRSRTFMVLNT